MDEARIVPGEFYEDCRYMPMLCIKADYDDGDDELVGISLINGYIGSCSADHCGVVRMTFDEALARKLDWNEFAEANGLPNAHPRDGTTRSDYGL